MKLTRQEKLKIRYQLLREAGYSSKEANKMKHWGDDKGVNLHYNKKTKKYGIRLNKKGKIRVTDEYKEERKKLKIEKQVQSYQNKVNKINNDTIYTKWGMLTEDKRYEDDTERMIGNLRKRHGWDNDQAHYFLYYMIEFNFTYRNALKELTGKDEFENYQKHKQARIQAKNKRFYNRHRDRILQKAKEKRAKLKAKETTKKKKTKKWKTKRGIR